MAKMKRSWRYVLEALSGDGEPRAQARLPNEQGHWGFGRYASSVTLEEMGKAGLIDVDRYRMCTITPAGRAALTEGEKS